MTNRRPVQLGKGWLPIILVAGLAVVALPAGAQEQASPSGGVKKVPVHQNNMVQGALLYRNYCATCHGMAGKGNGPAAPALKTAPPDLTVMAKNNDGIFPELKVLHVLESGPDLAAHGSKDMPIWGPIFRSMGPDRSLGHLRQVNLTDYLKSIQEK
jgi:mono/diheme cytochrome c family protein